MNRPIIILDNIRSAYNVGAIVRSGVGFNIVDYIAVGATAYPKLTDDLRLPHIAVKAERQIAKTSLGAEKQARFRYFTDAATCLEYLRTNGVKLLALEQSDVSRPLKGARPVMPYALVLGNEVSGVSSVFLDHAEEVLEIPLPGPKESLNVAVAAGIALYELTG